jgi:hypothetical protein
MPGAGGIAAIPAGSSRALRTAAMARVQWAGWPPGSDLLLAALCASVVAPRGGGTRGWLQAGRQGLGPRVT